MPSDLFDALDPKARLDVVFWNSNVVHAPVDFGCPRGLDHAVCDRDDAAHRRYLRDGLARLSASGRLVLGFNSLGDIAQLDAAAAEAGVRVTEHAALTRAGGRLARDLLNWWRSISH